MQDLKTIVVCFKHNFKEGRKTFDLLNPSAVQLSVLDVCLVECRS